MRASRVKRARWEAVCALCGNPIWVGNQIGFCRGVGWSHTSCIIATQLKADNNGTT